jgi:hypothetical protein
MRLTRFAVLASAALIATTMATAAAGAAPARHAHATQQIVVRPVNAHGHPAAGFVRKDENFKVSCRFDHGHGSVSTVAVDPHIFYCSPDAAYAIACWDAARDHRVLCFQNAFQHKVVRFRGNAPTHLDTPSQPYNALNLVLADGEHCAVRSGGAVGIQKHHPNWIATYFCGGGANILWAPHRLVATLGTDRSTSRWHAWVGTAGGRLHYRAITKAFFVGTAGA